MDRAPPGALKNASRKALGPICLCESNAMTYTARLILFAPREENADLMAASLSAAFQGGRIDAVIVTLPDDDERSQINFVKALVPIVHEAGAVLLIVDAFEMVARTGADGVHLSSPARVIEATAAMRRIERSVGVGGLKARHDAMEAAELGADYVMFGETRPDGSIPTLSMVLERAEWWAELFNTPCVAFASEEANIAPLVATGAEFIGLGVESFQHPDGIGALIKRALTIIAETPAPQRDK